MSFPLSPFLSDYAPVPSNNTWVRNTWSARVPFYGK